MKSNNPFSDSRIDIQGSTPHVDKGTNRFRIIFIIGSVLMLAAFIYAAAYTPEIRNAGNEEDTNLDQTALNFIQIENKPDPTAPEQRAKIQEVKNQPPPTAISPSPEPAAPQRDLMAEFRLELLKNAIEEEANARKSPIAVNFDSQIYQSGNTVNSGRPITNSTDRRDQLLNAFNEARNQISAQANSSAAATSGQLPLGFSTGQSNYDANAPKDFNDPVRLAAQNPGTYGKNNYGTDYMGDFKQTAQRTIRAGTIINARTLQGINSDTPGMVRAQIINDVYDSVTGRHLLIPKGSFIIGRYASGASYGDTRIPVVWDRIQFRNGDVFNIQAAIGSDSAGYAGFKDKVNNKYGKLFGQILLFSLFNALADTGDTTNPGGFNDEFEEQIQTQTAQAGLEITRRNLKVSPTLTIRPGYEFVIQVTSDFVFNESYIR